MMDPLPVNTLGDTALDFEELIASGSLISEANATGAGILQPKAKVSIGNPRKDSWAFYNLADTAYYTVPGSPDQLPLDFARLPEPSSLLLATLAALGGVAFRRRRGSHPSRPRLRR